MPEQVHNPIDFTIFEDIAMARVEPFGVHLFEAIFYVLLGLLIAIAVRSFIRSISMMMTAPKRDEYSELATGFQYVESTCAECQWTGELPSYRRRCPNCGSTVFV
ncbi:MAG: hypothetical protein M5R36_16330 [Deltaproteobacteria bacterium]|nr:hypothetical protein [Deltaproteobacteria bacterium]